MLLFPGLVVTATGSGNGDVDAAAGTPGIAGVVSAVVGVAGVAACTASSATAATAVAVTRASATALSFSVISFSVPVAMHLSRYGRLPSWNKSRTQCLVIFHSSTM